MRSWTGSENIAPVRCHVEKIPALIETLAGRSMELPPPSAVCEGELDNHHWVPKHGGGSDDRENRVVLCSKHHGMVHRLLNIYGWAELDPRQSLGI